MTDMRLSHKQLGMTAWVAGAVADVPKSMVLRACWRSWPHLHLDIIILHGVVEHRALAPPNCSAGRVVTALAQAPPQIVTEWGQMIIKVQHATQQH